MTNIYVKNIGDLQVTLFHCENSGTNVIAYKKAVISQVYFIIAGS